MTVRGLVWSLMWLLLTTQSSALASGETIDICFNYGCDAQAAVQFAESDLLKVRQMLDEADDAASEREVLAQSLALLYRIAGQQTPIVADRGGNLLDAGVNGRMDCIDHSTSTTRLMQVLESRGWLRHHRVIEPVRRGMFLSVHLSAALEERLPSQTMDERSTDHVGYLLMLCDCADVLNDLQVEAPAVEHAMPRFAVDTWFLDHGEPAVILPLADWLKGDGPNVQ